MHLALKQALCAQYSGTRLKEPCSFTRVQMAPILLFITSSGYEKKEPRYAGLSKAKASLSHRTWTEVSSSVTHFLQVGLLLNPHKNRFLLRVLCLVRRPVTTLD
jgi:hypothetical protein